MRQEEYNLAVRGIGWVDDRAWGCALRGESAVYTGAGGVAPWKQPELLGGPVKNMGRFDDVARMTVTACALALRDDGVRYGGGSKHELALVGTNAAGCLEANRAYLQDYLDAGRKLARGNLFVYTLPSSPLAEASIHFGLTGPMLYIGFPGGGLVELLEAGAVLMADGAAPGVLAVKADAREGVAVLLEKPAPAGAANYAAACRVCASAANAPVRELAGRLAAGIKESGGA